jgi:hypothetical protein
MNEELTKLMTDSYDQGVKDALESIKEGLDALPKREWVGLMDDEVMEMMGYDKQYGHIPQYARNFVEAISAKLKEKNG